MCGGIFVRFRKGNFLGSDEEFIKYVRNRSEQTNIFGDDDLCEDYGKYVKAEYCELCGNLTANIIKGYYICKNCEVKKKEQIKQLEKNSFKEEYDFNKIRLDLNDWTIPGMGEVGVLGTKKNGDEIKCMSKGITSFCKNFDGAMAQYIKCGKMICPNCWSKWRTELTFKLVCKLEAFARVKGTRLAHVTASMHPLKCPDRNWKEIKYRLFDRTYRRCKKKEFFNFDFDDYKIKLGKIKYGSLRKKFKEKRNKLCEDAKIVDGERNNNFYVEEEGIRTFEFVLSDDNKITVNKFKMGVMGGLRIFHPFRFDKNMDSYIRKRGYGDDNRRLWAFLRDLVNDTDHKLHEFVKLNYHLHLIVAPDFLEEHSNKDFVIKKISTSNGILDTIRMVKYQLSHAGVSKLRDRNKPTGFFGDLHRFKPGEELGEKKFLLLQKLVAQKMGFEFDEEDGLIYIEDTEEKCPNCGTDVDNWISAGDIIKMTGEDAMAHYQQLNYEVGEEFAALFKKLFYDWSEKIQRGITFLMLENYSTELNCIGVAIIYRGYDPPDDQLSKLLHEDYTWEKAKVDLDLDLEKNSKSKNEVNKGITLNRVD